MGGAETGGLHGSCRDVIFHTAIPPLGDGSIILLQQYSADGELYAWAELFQADEAKGTYLSVPNV